MRVLRDAPRKRGPYRSEEWIGHGRSPDEIDGLVRAHARGRFRVCVLLGAGESDAALRAAFKRLNYRLNTTESLMVHDLESVPQVPSPALIQRVTSRAEADELAQAAGARLLRPEHLAPEAALRVYVALIDGRITGWVRSSVIANAGWCSSMFVAPPFRRRGIARAMLCRMLHDDRAAGAATAVLLASHTGAKLYSVVGYRELGTLFVYTPSRRRDEPTEASK